MNTKKNDSIATAIKEWNCCFFRSVGMKCAILLFAAFCVMQPMKVEAAAKPSITVKAVSNLTSTNAQINATINNPGKVRLKRCGFLLYDSKGKILANRCDKINYTLKSFNGWFDLNEYYGKLTPGTVYKYRFYVMNAYYLPYFSQTYSFTTPKVSDASTKKLSYNAAAIKSIGAQPKNSVYCSVFAISYARAVAGKTPYSNPYAYWSKNGAVWGSGGMVSKGFATQQAALKAVYDQIKAGKPAILYVYGPKAAQHYVTVIGYQNVTNVNKLSMSDFVCIDPGYGTEKPLSDYTAPKMTRNKTYQVVVLK